MTIPRREIIDESMPGVYHITTRCVRRAFLCGKDSYSGSDYEHRRVWVRNRIRRLAEVFAVDLLGYAVMNNHLHLVLRNRPDKSRSWSGEEIAEKWLRVVSTHQSADPSKDPSSVGIEAIASNPRRVAELRRRLSSISCFMAKLNEYISRRANKEEGLCGRFWEGRFKSSRLKDEAAIVACMVYVDLNPVRARIASSLEDSDYTSGQDRLLAEQGRRRVLAYRKRRREGEVLSGRQEALLAAARRRARSADFLVPFGRSSKGMDLPVAGFTESTYLELVDWTGRQVRAGKRGSIPDRILPILEGLEVDTKRWVRTVERFGSLFHRLVARAEDMAEAARTKGRRWFHGVRACREFYGEEPQQA